MQRREFIAAVSAAAMARPAGEEWIRVADSRCNLNGIVYPPKLLAAIARVTKERRIVISKSDDAGGEPELQDVIGIVSDARITDGLLEIQAYWFSGCRPAGKFLTPSGVTDGRDPDFAADRWILKKYALHFFAANEESAFECATPVSA